MNPFLAFVLTFFIVHIGMVVIHVVLVIIVTRDIIATTGKTRMPYSEMDEEIQARPLGRFTLNMYPVAFWWFLLWDRINHD